MEFVRPNSVYRVILSSLIELFPLREQQRLLMAHSQMER